MRGATWTRIVAWTDCWFIRYNKATIGTIIDVGISRQVEVGSWWQLLPGIPILGIEPRFPKPPHWQDPWLQVALGEKDIDEPVFCWTCQSATACKRPNRHRDRRVPVWTLDRAVEASGVSGPFYLWMDTDGAEVGILNGASRTLAQTTFLHTEVMDNPVGERLVQWLTDHQWALQHIHRCFDTDSVDHLYTRGG